MFYILSNSAPHSVWVTCVFVLHSRFSLFSEIWRLNVLLLVMLVVLAITKLHSG